MLIDIPLLRLRYEILNVTLEELAADVDTPLQILRSEAKSNGWKQWWPYDILIDPSSVVAPPTTTPSNATESSLSGAYSPTVAGMDEDDLVDDDDESDLEVGSRAFLRDTSLRLQVFNMAKEVYLSHKYAGLESALIDAASAAAGTNTTPQDLKHLSSIFKDLATHMTSGKSLSIGTTDDGLPTVIIRDLRGRDPK